MKDKFYSGITKYEPKIQYNYSEIQTSNYLENVMIPTFSKRYTNV